MKRAYALAVFLLALGASAQTNRFPPINLYAGDPTGNACSGNLIQQSSTTGLIYTCQAGAMKVASAGGTVSGQTANCLPKASGASALTAASAVCDNGTTVNSTLPISAPAFSAPLLTVTACTTGQAPLGDGSGACFTPVGGGTVNPGQLAFAQYPTSTGAAVSPSNFTYDAATGNTMNGPHFAPAATPYSDITNATMGGGAIIDGATPIDTALLAAWNAATGTGGSGTVFLPCGTAGCYLANGSLLSTVTTPTNTARIKIQGRLILGSTWITPDNTDIICDGNGIPQQFQISGPTCFIDAPNVTGTMGTSTSAINSPTTFTPTFTTGTSANMPANSAITIAGTVSCPITSVTRTLLAGPYPGIGPTNVIAQVSGACRIPPGSYVTIAGVTDSSFNMNPGLFVITDDYPNGVLTWRQVGAAATSSGGTVTGVNLDSVETVRIQASVSGVMTATFNHAHSASDVWGMVGMSPKFAGLRKHGFYGIHLAHNYGVGFWGDGNALMTFHEVGFTGFPYPTSFGMEFASSWGWTFDSSAVNAAAAYVCPTSQFNCAQSGFPYGIRATELPQSQLGTSGVGLGFVGPNSTVGAGILIDTEGSGGTPFLQGPEIFNSVIEQPMENGITFDSRGATAIYQTTIYGASLIQDSFVTASASWVGLTDPAPGKGEVMFMNAANLNYLGDTLPGAVGSTVNKYFCGHVTLAGNSGYDHFVWPSCPSATVTYAGWKLAGELSGSGAQFNPSFIPYTTKTVTTNVTTCTGTGCSVTTGLPAPDNSNTAFQINAGAGAFANAQYLNYFNASTATGDVLLYGAWTRSVGMSSGVISLVTFGTDTFDLTSTATFQGGIDNEPWHVVIGMSTVKTGQAGSHALSFQLSPSVTMGGTSTQFWQPFVIHVPASAGISADEISRWRANLLHGYVPSGLGTANVLEINPALPLMWGTDTNLYRGAAGVVKTDGSYDAAKGFLCGGAAGTSGFALTSGGAGNPCTYTAFAPLASPALTGTPTTPTAAPGTNTTQIASTAFVAASFAPIASPTFTGTPAAPTATAGTNTTQLASTAFVQAAVGAASGVTLAEWMSGGSKTAGVSMLTNTTQLWNFVLPGSLTSTKITYTPSTADNSANLYDMGIYSATGTLLCHLGATAGTTFAPNTNSITLSWLSSCALSGGVRYLFAETAVTPTAFISTGGLTLLGQNRQAPSAGGTTVGGVLNNSVTVGTDAPSTANGFPQIWLHN